MARNKNSRIFLERVLAVQEAYQVEKIHEGVTDSWVYRHCIKPRFQISYGTMKRYLEINAKRFLRSMSTDE